MEIRYEKHWSGWLNRDMEFKIYGSCGKPVIFIPCQAGRFWDFESFQMVDYWAPWIESGKCMVFSIDTIDNESWAAVGADNRFGHPADETLRRIEKAGAAVFRTDLSGTITIRG